jgi:hypothetical protein
MENRDSQCDSAANLTASNEAADTPNASPGGIGSGRFIPNRESSLRHSYSESSTKKRRSARHSGYSSRDFTIDRDIAEVNPEEDQVTHRAQEPNARQDKIKDELLSDYISAPSSGRTPRPGPRSSAHPIPSAELLGNRLAGKIEEEMKKVAELKDEPDESAPSPAVLTRKTLSRKRNSGPLASKPTNIQPILGKQSLEQANSQEQKRQKRRSIPLASPGLQNHRRSRSGALSPVPRVSISTEDRPSSADSIDYAVDAYLTAPRLTQKVPHPHTGRIIAFSEVGDPKGHVLFCCVGMGLTRYLTAFYDELAWTLKLRLITPDRPGVGESEPCLDGSGTPLNWPGKIGLNPVLFLLDA